MIWCTLMIWWTLMTWCTLMICIFWFCLKEREGYYYMQCFHARREEIYTFIEAKLGIQKGADYFPIYLLARGYIYQREDTRQSCCHYWNTRSSISNLCRDKVSNSDKRKVHDLFGCITFFASRGLRCNTDQLALHMWDKAIYSAISAQTRGTVTPIR